jgi:hypothetical protein
MTAPAKPKPTTTRQATTTTVAATTTTLAQTTTTAGATTTTLPSSCTGVTVLPTQDLSAVMAANPAGTTYCLQGGTHRETVQGGINPETGDKLIGVGQNVVVDGAKVLSGWAASGSDWVATGFLPSGPPGSQTCEAGFPACYWPQDIFRDGVWLTTVNARASLAPGKAFLDYPNNKVYVRDDPNAHLMEQSWATRLFGGSGQNVQIKNLAYQHAASPPNGGAVDPAGTGWVLDHVDARWNHGYGTGPGQVAYGQTLAMTITASHVHHNGQDGTGADGVGNLVQGNEVNNNSYAGYDDNWDAGNKFGHARNLQVLGNYYHDERGPAIWCDINCETVTISGNYVKNALNGIMYEISCGASIHDNVVVGSTNAEAGASIFISNSKDAEVYNNQIYGGPRAIWAWHVDRPEATQPGCPVHEIRNLNVHDNQMDLNPAGPVWGAKVGLWTDQMTNAFYTSMNNRFTNNTYHDTTPGSDDWNWHVTGTNGYADTNPFNVWQGYGNDTTGSVVNDNPTPPAPPVLVVGPQP